MPPLATNSGSLFDSGLNRLKDIQERRNAIDFDQQQLFSSLGHSVSDNLETYRLSLRPLVKSLFSQANENTKWLTIGIAWLHVGGNYSEFFQLMSSTPARRRHTFLGICTDDKRVDVLLKYIDLLYLGRDASHPPKLDGFDQRVHAMMQNEGIDLTRLRQLVEKEYKTKPEYFKVQPAIKSFFENPKNTPFFEDVQISNIHQLVEKLEHMGQTTNPHTNFELGIDESDISDFASLITALKYAMRRTSNSPLFGMLLKILSKSQANPELQGGEIGFIGLLQLSIPGSSDHVYENEMKDAVLRALEHEDTPDAVIYAVVSVTNGALMPDLSQRYAMSGATSGASKLTAPAIFTPVNLGGGYWTVNLFGDPKKKTFAAQQLYNIWRNVARLSKLEEHLISECDRLNTTVGGSEGIMKMMSAVRDACVSDEDAEQVLLGAVLETRSAGIAQRIWKSEAKK
ncbi:hypothetical protein M3P05_08340 [Sansalvadorimonas sp. 2012CJ34-2]|uniref:Uncharacterized protein n=1 Tax=Parendozoicomonas callyspongiae TaxID=2942213 RepID=A0ABT0PEZ0_9GAMM|nr:hypothetical protein [Sansalvadorimonas sp. 2012CJ34-2]MCL6269945.1 hypothetical protein [Sansalvadorimonas sp. 2012CJ34-2]